MITSDSTGKLRHNIASSDRERTFRHSAADGYIEPFADLGAKRSFRRDGRVRKFVANRTKVSFAESTQAKRYLVRMTYPGEKGRTHHYLA